METGFATPVVGNGLTRYQIFNNTPEDFPPSDRKLFNILEVELLRLPAGICLNQDFRPHLEYFYLLNGLVTFRSSPAAGGKQPYQPLNQILFPHQFIYLSRLLGEAIEITAEKDSFVVGCSHTPCFSRHGREDVETEVLFSRPVHGFNPQCIQLWCTEQQPHVLEGAFHRCRVHFSIPTVLPGGVMTLCQSDASSGGVRQKQEKVELRFGVRFPLLAFQAYQGVVHPESSIFFFSSVTAQQLELRTEAFHFTKRP